VRDFLDDISGPIETDPEGAPRGRAVRMAVLVVGEKLGPHELETLHNGLTAELYRHGLLRCGFEDQNPETGEITSVGELTDAEMIERDMIERKWAPKIEAARLKDDHG